MKFSTACPLAFGCLAVLLIGGCSAAAPASSTPEPTAVPVASAEIITFAKTDAPSPTPILTPTPAPAKTAGMEGTSNAGGNANASASAAAQMLRMEETSELVNYWATVQPDATKYFRQRKAVRAMLACTVGSGIQPV